MKDTRINLSSPQNAVPVNKDSIEGLTRDTDHKVKGTFMNLECPGQTAKVSGLFYKGMQYFSQVFKDNEKYEIPISVARFINERCCNYKASRLTDASGNPITETRPTSRYKFIIDGFAA